MVKVSVIIPAWKAERFVGAAIASARAQSLRDLEIIVVNDCSPDDTHAAAVRTADGDDRVRIIDLPANSGPAAARNRGIETAQGEWLAMLDADDTMAPTRLAHLISFAQGRGLDIAADDLRLVYHEGAGKPYLRLRQRVNIDLAAYAAGNKMFSGRRHTGYLKPIFRAAFMKSAGLSYDPDVRIGEDYMLVATALALGASYGVAPEALYDYSVRDGSLSRRLGAQDLTMLIAADDRFMARFGATLAPRARGAVLARRASLEDALAFVTAVDALKARDLRKAFTALARRPASVRHFSMPIGARLARMFGGRGGRND